MMVKAGDYVVVTTDRGVFGGVLSFWDPHTRIAELCEARCAVTWSTKTKGFIGLASHGPQEGSRITAAAPLLSLVQCTSVSVATDEARKLWEAAPWAELEGAP